MADWASILWDLVGRILAHLPCLAHRAAFGAVCVNWRAVEAEHPPPPQLPWLLLPSAAAETPFFFCIRCSDRHRAFLPNDVRTAHCFGSNPGGWLVLALHQAPHPQQGERFALHNFSGDEPLPVPGILETPDDIGEVVMTVLGAALSAAPTADGAFLAVVLAQCQSPIGFCIPGMENLSPPTPFEPHERGSWRDMLPRRAQIADVIYYSGHGLEGFHVLTDNEKVLVYTPEFALDGKLTTGLVTYHFPDHQKSTEPGCTASRYLVNFFGDLVMVVRFVSTEQDGGTRRIRAFQLSFTTEAEEKWDEWWFPANCVVMLGRCSSRAFVSPVITLSGIYFLDDANSFGGQPFPCWDMGRCTVHHEEQIEQVFPLRPPSEFSPAVWYFH